jgi:hypothetical protein
MKGCGCKKDKKVHLLYIANNEKGRKVSTPRGSGFIHSLVVQFELDLNWEQMTIDCERTNSYLISITRHVHHHTLYGSLVLEQPKEDTHEILE